MKTLDVRGWHNEERLEQPFSLANLHDRMSGRYFEDMMQNWATHDGGAHHIWARYAAWKRGDTPSATDLPATAAMAQREDIRFFEMYGEYFERVRRGPRCSTTSTPRL